MSTRDPRRPPALLLGGALLLALAAFDAFVTTPGWPYASLLGVPVLVVTALARADPHRRAVLVGCAVALSSVGTAALASVHYEYLGTFGLAEAGALLLAVTVLWRSAHRRRDRVLVASTAVALVALSARSLTVDTVLYATLLTLAAAVAAVVGAALRSADVQHHHAVAAVRRAEREEIARELHDVVAHHVTGIIVTSQATRWVADTAGSPVPPALTSALASIETSGTEALASMRRLVEVLRTPDTGATRVRTPQLGDLAELVDRFAATGSVGAVQLDVTSTDTGADDGPGDGPGDVADPVDLSRRTPAELQAAVYRVVQEALTNVQRHARGAERVRVQVTGSLGAVDVLVANTPGRPAPPTAAPAGGGFGVIGLRERVDALGGTLRIGPQGDGGWAVQAHLPTRGACGPIASHPPSPGRARG